MNEFTKAVFGHLTGNVEPNRAYAQNPAAVAFHGLGWEKWRTSRCEELRADAV